MVWSCSGCRSVFTHEGYLAEHFRLSKSLLCIHAGEVHIQTIQERPFRRNPPRSHRSISHKSSASESPHQDNDGPRQSSSTAAQQDDGSGDGGDSREEDEEPPPVPFEGDYFGNDYEEGDFPFGEHTEHSADNLPDVLGLSQKAPPVHEDSDDEDDEALRALNDGVTNGRLASPPPPSPSPPPPPHSPQLQPHSQSSSPNPPSPPPPSHPQPAVEDEPSSPPGVPGPNENEPSAPGGIEAAIHNQLRVEPAHIVRFGGLAGSPIDPHTLPTSGYHGYGNNVDGSAEDLHAPFCSEIDWEVAAWAKKNNISSNTLTDLLSIKGLVDSLGISYKNANELNAIIDNKLPNWRPAFSRYVAEVMGEKFELYACPILECIISLYRDPEHARYLCFAPERHYTDSDQKIRLYHDLHTGQWWWTVQETLEEVEPGATVIQVIISSDKTQVTLFRNKSAYPVYLTIGNLPKSIRQKPGRQGQILLAYLPTSRLDHITNKAARRRVVQNMFHACMTQLLAPLRSAGLNGIVMTGGDGIARRCHPILATYVGDYPEQCLVTCSYSGDCPICQCTHSDLGVFPLAHEPRDFEAAREAVKSLDRPNRFAEACNDANIKPVQHPFWEDLVGTGVVAP